MATDNVSLSVDPREVTGKKVRALRRSGITPVHLYGGGGPSLTLQAETQALRTAVNTAGRGQPISIPFVPWPSARTHTSAIHRSATVLSARPIGKYCASLPPHDLDGLETPSGVVRN